VVFLFLFTFISDMLKHMFHKVVGFFTGWGSSSGKEEGKEEEEEPPVEGCLGATTEKGCEEESSKHPDAPCGWTNNWIFHGGSCRDVDPEDVEDEEEDENAEESEEGRKEDGGSEDDQYGAGGTQEEEIIENIATPAASAYKVMGMEVSSAHPSSFIIPSIIVGAVLLFLCAIYCRFFRARKPVHPQGKKSSSYSPQKRTARDKGTTKTATTFGEKSPWEAELGLETNVFVIDE